MDLRWLPKLAENVDCQATLASLCRVSKSFQVIFTPILYRHLWLDYCPFSFVQNISQLPSSRLGLVKTFIVGRHVQITIADEREGEVEALSMLLDKMTTLKALSIIGPLYRDLFLDIDVDTDDEDASDDDKIVPLRQVASRKLLQDLTLINSKGDDHVVWRIPSFENLRHLDLLKLHRSESFEVADIVDVLLASPNLASFGLSCNPTDYMENDLLRVLTKCYHTKREELKRPLLQLSKLRLGLGCLPVDYSLYYPGEDEDYMIKLTDLKSLKELRLDNWSQGSDYKVPDFPIHSHLFRQSVHLREIKVESLNRDIVQLITELNQRPEDVCLQGLEISRFFETFRAAYEPVEPAYEDEAERLYSESPEFIGNHWRRVSWGTNLELDTRHMTKHLLRNFIAKCSDIEELSIPMGREDLDLFKLEVMPKLKKLHTVMLPRGYLSELTVPKAPFVERDSKRRKLTDDLEAQKTEQKQDQQRIELVKELFECNRRIVQRDSSVCPLRYIGISVHVYCCMHPVPQAKAPVELLIEYESSDAAKFIEKFHIIKLSSTQARAFEAVRHLDENSNFPYS